MAYEVLSDDLYEGSSNSGSRPKRRKTRGNDENESSSAVKFNSVYLHVIIILVIIVGLFFYFSSDFNFNINEKSNSSTIILIGDIENFTHDFNSLDITLHSSEFILEAQEGIFTDTGKDFKITNFTGNIRVENKSLLVDGSALRLEYDKNLFQLKGNKFNLTSTKKTTIDLYFDNISLDFKSGRIKLDENLNYDFKNSTISMQNYNTTMSYDGTFSFTGYSKHFNLFVPTQHLTLSYSE